MFLAGVFWRVFFFWRSPQQTPLGTQLSWAVQARAVQAGGRRVSTLTDVALTSWKRVWHSQDADKAAERCFAVGWLAGPSGTVRDRFVPMPRGTLVGSRASPPRTLDGSVEWGGREGGREWRKRNDGGMPGQSRPQRVIWSENA